MIAHNLKKQSAAETYYVGWQCFVAAFLVATIGITVDAAPLTFDDPTVTTEDRFGRSVALDGNNVLVGAYRDDTLGSLVGQAHLFDATTGNLLRTFDDPTVTANDRFGNSVAVDSNYVLIGAPYDDTFGTNIGQAHLFDATTGSLLHTFNDPTVTRSDNFGVSVALDGNNVLIGARGDDTYGSNTGQAHLFDTVTGDLLQTFDDPTLSGSEDWFGASVALDGNNVLVGAYGDDTFGNTVGQAHLFDATTGNFLRTFDDPTVTQLDGFGLSVAIDGNYVLIGAPWDDTNGEDVGQVHLFDATTGNLLHTFNDPTVTGEDVFGRSVALDGNNVLIGAREDNTYGIDVGQVHLFDAVTGNLLGTFSDPTVTDKDWFGSSVALDGDNVLVGAPRDDTNGTNVGQAHLFDITDFSEPPLDPTADFNSDDKVDGDDLAIWESFFGTPNPFGSPVHEFGDADEDDDIDGNDFLAWQREFGYGLATSAASVPEPSTLVLGLLAAVGLMVRRRSSRQRFFFLQKQLCN